MNIKYDSSIFVDAHKIRRRPVEAVVFRVNHSHFDQVGVIHNIENPVERAYAYSAWAAYNQFFFDGNKRTGRLVMNGILLSNGYDALTITAARQLEYNTSCLELYETGDASRLFRMMLGRHLEISNPKRGVVL